MSHRRPRPHSARAVLALGMLVAAGGAAPSAAAAQGAGPEAAGAIADLGVMTFNIRYGTARDGDDAWPLRRDLVFEVIRTAAPAVLGTQEALAFQVDELARALPTYEPVGVGRDDGARAGEFAAIFVDRTRLEVLDHGTFWFSDTPSVPGSTSWGNRIPRICTWARLRDRASGRRFYVYNVHWDHESQPSRERSAAALLDAIAARAAPADPVLVTGDFNAGEENPAFEALLAGDTGLRDTFRARHPDAAEVGTFNGFEGARNGDKIDAILAAGAWCVRSATIVRTSRAGRYPSDHFPVTAVVSSLDPADADPGCGDAPDG